MMPISDDLTRMDPEVIKFSIEIPKAEPIKLGNNTDRSVKDKINFEQLYI